MRIKFNRTPQAQQFRYIPRYWDPEEEEREKLRQRVKDIQDGSVEGVKKRLAGGFRRGYANEDVRRSRNRLVLKSNYILLGTIVLLLILSYILLTAYMPDMLEAIYGTEGGLTE